MARRSISSEIKAQIVEAMAQEGSKALEVSKRFGVSLPSVYNWVKAANEANVVSTTVEA